MDNIEKRADVGCAPYAGSGKLTDYREDGSWVMNQIDKGYENCDRGIRVNKPEDGGNIRFSSVQSRIASLITASAEEFRIEKAYRQLSSSSRNNYRFALRWSLFGDLDGSTLEDLLIVKELLGTGSPATSQSFIRRSTRNSSIRAMRQSTSGSHASR